MWWKSFGEWSLWMRPLTSQRTGCWDRPSTVSQPSCTAHHMKSVVEGTWPHHTTKYTPTHSNDTNPQPCTPTPRHIYTPRHDTNDTYTETPHTSRYVMHTMRHNTNPDMTHIPTHPDMTHTHTHTHAHTHHTHPDTICTHWDMIQTQTHTPRHDMHRHTWNIHPDKTQHTQTQHTQEIMHAAKHNIHTQTLIFVLINILMGLTNASFSVSQKPTTKNPLRKNSQNTLWFPRHIQLITKTSKTGWHKTNFN